MLQVRYNVLTSISIRINLYFIQLLTNDFNIVIEVFFGEIYILENCAYLGIAVCIFEWLNTRRKDRIHFLFV